ncbi:putative glycosyltransferase [Sulfolobus polyhedral virus 2]|uniref:Putative glycosyltransferase n=1 Tax=Sulfolobus polyhedral virus 2 TaxID=2493125 RepID=A0A3Q8Q4A3_9VIRU|nr:glycosyltransferase [Sulfolobus polyhedral virus 2]AZI76027.1 putative glycosyltransferase [Sulfolobus polyhedral virus 2]
MSLDYFHLLGKQTQYIDSKRSTNIYSGCVNCSLNVVAQRLQYYLAKYYSKNYTITNSGDNVYYYVIADINHALANAFNANILWVDTAYMVDNMYVNPNLRYNRIITTSQWNKRYLEKYVKDVEIVNRGINEEIADRVAKERLERKYKFIVVATDERKNSNIADAVLRELNMRDKALFICNFPFCEIKTFTLSEYEIHKYYAKAQWLIWLSNAEGFGLPPVEAQSVGTGVIYADHEYQAENVKVHRYNIPVNSTSYLERRGQMIYPKSRISIEDLKQKLKEAGEITNEQRKEIIGLIHELYSHKTILPKLL